MPLSEAEARRAGLIDRKGRLRERGENTPQDVSAERAPQTRQTAQDKRSGRKSGNATRRAVAAPVASQDDADISDDAWAGTGPAGRYPVPMQHQLWCAGWSVWQTATGYTAKHWRTGRTVTAATRAACVARAMGEGEW